MVREVPLLSPICITENILKVKYIRFFTVSAIFVAFAFWIFSVLSSAYMDEQLKESEETITLFTQTVPAELDDVPLWLEGASRFLPNAQILFFPYDDDSEDFIPFDYEHADYCEELLAFWNESKSDEAFLQGIESAYYGEIYRFENYFFAPIMDEEGFFTESLLFIKQSEDISAAGGKFVGLLAALLVLATVIFIVAFGISSFARDAFVGYSVLILFVIAGFFIAYPFFEALRLTFVRDGEFSLYAWKQIFSRDALRALVGSLQLGAFTATVSTFIGFIFAFAVERTSIKGKKFITAMANMPIISPPFSLTLSIILLAGNNGLITNQLLKLENFSIYGLGGLVLVQTICMFPIAFMTLQGILRSIDSTVEDASLDLSATKLQTFFNVTLPLSMPGILSAWLLVFTNSLADFANPLLLAGNFRVLSVEAYIAVTGRNDFGLGSALSIMVLLPTLTAFFLQRYWVEKRSFVTITGKPSLRLTELTTPTVRRIISVFVYAIIIFISLLYLTIVAGCFVKNWGIDYTFTLENIVEGISRGMKSIVDTITLAAIATPIAGILAMITALLLVRKTFIGKRVLEVLLMSPFAVPGTLVGIAYILAFNEPPLVLVGTGAIMVINYIIRELPVGIENGVASLRQIDKSIEEAAYDLGADSPTVFRTIVLPLIRPAFITGMSYTFVRSMTAVSAVVFLISARWYHITMQIYNFSENLRFGLASVLSTVLILIILAVFGLLRILVPDRGNMQKTVS
ncbi:MAG: iron ABC transporter permease [Spirochaetaceae bacterium]|nr:iron ABC transporter permease [Spirochaetaceae bacterium]